MTTQAETVKPPQATPKKLYAIIYPDCLTDGGGPLTIRDVMALSRENIVGLITRREIKIPKPFTMVIDFAVVASDTFNPYALSEVLFKIAENFEADEYYLVARGFRFHAAANLSGFTLIFPHTLLGQLRSARKL